MDSTTSVGETAPIRHSLFDAKDDFIHRIAPVGVAAIYFGGFSLAPQDVPLSRQALFKLSFLNRHFLQAGGLKIVVNKHTAVLSGTVAARALATMANILALQIEGITSTQDDTIAAESDTPAIHREKEPVREAVQFLFATDQTLRSGVQVTLVDGLPTVSYTDTDKAGAYQMSIATSPPTVIDFAAQSDPNESNLTPLSDQQLDTLSKVAEVIKWTPDFKLTEKLTAARVGTELWWPLLIAALIAATVETFLAQRFSKSK